MTTPDDYLQAAWKIHQSGNVNQAYQMYRQVVDQLPRHANGWCFLGIALHDLKRYDEAIEAYEKALAIQPVFPIALNNMGNSLRYAYRPEDSDAAFARALKIDPNYLNAHKNRGTLHAWLGNIDQAIESYRKAKRLAPDEAETHRNLGVIYLLQGKFELGWQEYRWRWKCAEAGKITYSQPKWHGQDLKGKTILLYAEQGLGDAIHFIRFAEVLKQKGAVTIIHGPPALTALLKGCKGIDLYVPNSLPIQHPFDYHCSLIDVADVLQINDKNIPFSEGYITPPNYLIDYWINWKNKLPPAKMYVGLAWQGNRDHQADQFRSYPLKTYEAISQNPDVQFVSLQQGFGAEQISQWKGARPIIQLPEGTDKSSGAFMDTSAILTQLDLLITSDTAIAHLAGAINRPVWVLLNKMPDWRWLLDRPDTPWYKSMRLFRQKIQAEWGPVAEEVTEALKHEVALRNSPTE